jgi:outer membrane lipoprotein-sorting protein
LNNALKIFFLLILFIQAVTFVACSGSTGEELSKVPVKEIKQRINQNSKLIETLEASGNISFDSPEQSGSGWIEIKIKKPDTVYVKIEGPFGISIANALITRSDFVYYNVQENKVISGPSSDINIGAVLRIKVSFDELINGFTGGFNFPENEEDSSGADSENNLYVIQQNTQGSTQKYFVEPAKYTIKKYNSFNSKNETVVEVNYTNYTEESVTDKYVNFPTGIKIKNPSKSQTVYVDYINKEINKKDLTFKMKIPKSAKVIKWE